MSYSLPKASNVVIFLVSYGFWLGDYNIQPKKELHRRVWVNWGYLAVIWGLL